MDKGSTPGGFDQLDMQQRAADETALEKLRRLLMSPELIQLRQLQEQLEAHKLGIEDLSRLLPEAIENRSQPDTSLTVALLPTIGEAIKISVQQEPQSLVDAIFPIMGPAIRRAISEALNGMIQSFNDTLESRFSLRRLEWRWEAWQTGKSVAEVALFHSLIYRVEQVFLIHKETGLLLQHVVADRITAFEPHAVSGMLTAIRDFVQDSFRVGDEGALESFEVGDLSVWVEQGPYAILAAVIRGKPPYELRALFQDTLTTIRREQRPALSTFQGDTTRFAACRPSLEACLITQEARSAKRKPWLAAFVLAMGLVGLGVALFFPLRNYWRWTHYVDTLRAMPGIVVTHSERRRGRYVVAGLRDPLAADPQRLLQETKLPVENVHSQWEPYQASYPEFLLTRAQQILQPPESVSLHLVNGVLYVKGSAPHKWIETARHTIRLIPGINRWQAEALIDTDMQALKALTAALDPPETVTLHFETGTLSAVGTAPHAWIQSVEKRIESLPQVTHFRRHQLVDWDLKQLALYKERVATEILYFEENDVRLSPDQDVRIQRLVEGLQGFQTAAHTLGKHVRVTILGRADTRGSEQANLQLSQERADHIRTLLGKYGLDVTPFSAVGVGARAPFYGEYTDHERNLNRNVSFQVMVVDDLDR